MKKSYIILGDNNYWYASFEAETEQDIADRVQLLKDDISANAFADSCEMRDPQLLRVFEVQEIKQITL